MNGGEGLSPFERASGKDGLEAIMELCTFYVDRTPLIRQQPSQEMIAKYIPERILG